MYLPSPTGSRYCMACSLRVNPGRLTRRPAQPKRERRLGGGPVVKWTPCRARTGTCNVTGGKTFGCLVAGKGITVATSSKQWRGGRGYVRNRYQNATKACYSTCVYVSSGQDQLTSPQLSERTALIPSLAPVPTAIISYGACGRGQGEARRGMTVEA